MAGFFTSSSSSLPSATTTKMMGMAKGGTEAAVGGRAVGLPPVPAVGRWGRGGGGGGGSGGLYRWPRA